MLPKSYIEANKGPGHRTPIRQVPRLDVLGNLQVPQADLLGAGVGRHTQLVVPRICLRSRWSGLVDAMCYQDFPLVTSLGLVDVT